MYVYALYIQYIQYIYVHKTVNFKLLLALALALHLLQDVLPTSLHFAKNHLNWTSGLLLCISIHMFVYCMHSIIYIYIWLFFNLLQVFLWFYFFFIDQRFAFCCWRTALNLQLFYNYVYDYVYDYDYDYNYVYDYVYCNNWSWRWCARWVDRGVCVAIKCFLFVFETIWFKF